MAKKPRFKYVSNRQRYFKCGEVYHIFQRGNHELKTFSSDFERATYLNNLFRLCRRHRVRVHNFVLMGNHIHFVLEQLRVGAISKVMHGLQSPHARAHNKMINKKGNLWTQHYGCKHVDSAAYYRTLMHYVETNPVKIGKCSRAEEYVWSGARAHVADGPVTIRVEEGLEVRVDLFLRRWREQCGEQKKQGWTEFLEAHVADKEEVKKLEMILDGVARQRFANQEKVKRLMAERAAKRELEELAKKIGPGQARKQLREERRAREAAGRALGAG